MTRLILAIFTTLTLVACGTAQPPEAEIPVEAPPAPTPECLPGCALDKGECTTQGHVVDRGIAETEVIACDPLCCDPNSKAQSKVDADSDGIVNDRDECIDKAEDFDGFQDEDGCPEEDNDGDKILDEYDVCPLDAEDVDGFQDDDGCPD